ncbi:hypothetical protein KIW84_022251 [Lathyrus oleraceus]|uniref:Uncharacterized protein n=1 Tax=Pisum sativum TaxID=3888 RepID=A0A9D4YEI6_PEA|nr:hypothetical protein KIW84_022251 [Pisum sativum]
MAILLQELLRKLTRAWEKVHVKDNKPKRKDTSSEESHTPWIREKVHLVKLPFRIDPTYVPDMPNPITVSTNEVNRLKATIARLEQDKEILEHSLYDATYEKNQISYDLEQKDKQLLENMEELWTERSKRQKTLGGLFSVGVNFENLNGKLMEAQVIVQEQGDRAKAWRIEHSNLAEFANNLVQDIPRMFRRADGVANFHSTSQEVLEFMRLYDVMLKEFKAHLKRAMEEPL